MVPAQQRFQLRRFPVFHAALDGVRGGRMSTENPLRAQLEATGTKRPPGPGHMACSRRRCDASRASVTLTTSRPDTTAVRPMAPGSHAGCVTQRSFGLQQPPTTAA